MKKSILILFAAILSFTALSQTNINNSITGSGTTNYIPKFTAGKKIGNSVIYQNGSNVGIGDNTADAKLVVKETSSNYAKFGTSFPCIYKDASNYIQLNNDNIGVSILSASNSTRLKAGTGGFSINYLGIVGYDITYNLNDYMFKSFIDVDVNKFTINHSGFFGKNRLGISCDPTSNLHIKGNFGYNQLRLETKYSPTNSSDPNGNIGDVAWDEQYWYIKTSAGWKRTALSTF